MIILNKRNDNLFLLQLVTSEFHDKQKYDNMKKKQVSALVLDDQNKQQENFPCGNFKVLYCNHKINQ